MRPCLATNCVGATTPPPTVDLACKARGSSFPGSLSPPLPVSSNKRCGWHAPSAPLSQFLFCLSVAFPRPCLLVSRNLAGGSQFTLRLHATHSGCCRIQKLAAGGCRRHQRGPVGSQQLQVASHGIDCALGSGPDGQHCAAARRHLRAACTGGSAAGAQLQVTAACSATGGCCRQLCCLHGGGASSTAAIPCFPPSPCLPA